MGDSSTWHRLSNIDTLAGTGTCSVCGPTTIRDRGPKGAECRAKRLQHRKTAITTTEGRRKRFGWAIATKYGLTLDEFDALLRSQCGRCALCEAIDPRLSIDHDHQTGRVRGLLCRDCNRAIARWGDQAEGARRLLAYMTG